MACMAKPSRIKFYEVEIEAIMNKLEDFIESHPYIFVAVITFILCINDIKF